MFQPRIYADFNGIVGSFRTEGRSAVVLDTFGTLRELSNARILLKDGFQMMVYDWSDDEEDLEADVTTFFDPSRKQWIGEFDEKGLRYVQKKNRDESIEFHCWSCGVDLSTEFETQYSAVF